MEMKSTKGNLQKEVAVSYFIQTLKSLRLKRVVLLMKMGRQHGNKMVNKPSQIKGVSRSQCFGF